MGSRLETRRVTSRGEPKLETRATRPGGRVSFATRGKSSGGRYGAPALRARPGRLDEPLVLVRGGAQRCARSRRRPGRAALYPRGPAGSAQFPGSRVTPAAGDSPPAGLPTDPAPLLHAICCTAITQP
ncbi:unnamed protein product [Parnassius apollo]|uniref:(apollo) hypothetical protein n=1 Tax=Parnassius apollo TaxID=110799 RepID=A0A8S3Y5H9_PARAO|nr:unnamed protein product [Parnassius apollo]